MRCVRIGFGKISRIHEEHLRDLGVTTIGIVEVSPERVKEIREMGFNALDSIEAAVSLNPDFYDICTPTHASLIWQLQQSMRMQEAGRAAETSQAHHYSGLCQCAEARCQACL